MDLLVDLDRGVQIYWRSISPVTPATKACVCSTRLLFSKSTSRCGPLADMDLLVDLDRGVQIYWRVHIPCDTGNKCLCMQYTTLVQLYIHNFVCLFFGRSFIKSAVYKVRVSGSCCILQKDFHRRLINLSLTSQADLRVNVLAQIRPCLTFSSGAIYRPPKIFSIYGPPSQKSRNRTRAEVRVLYTVVLPTTTVQRTS